ncbi:MAG: formate dehydrogenase family accessory protein FdhD [Chloroflexi bacterium HGW-Chloroflexi-10]|nr:MAG: formate dehydrogenase family accessory protein FdhD [Chloroflexi bacterium HGW-Chloroflexi-10]
MNFTPNLPILYNQGVCKPSEMPAPDEINTDLTVNGEYWLTFSCSPFQIKELAVGFLYNEHSINFHHEIVQVWLCKDLTNVDVWLNHSVKKPENWKRTSGCTGGVTTQSPKKEISNTIYELICPKIITQSIEILLEEQTQYKLTRGIHCAMITDGNDLRYIAEDIGRHNTIDKLAGWMLQIPSVWTRKMIFTTGRISSEMLQKSAHIGASVVVSRTSPTKASIETATDLNITLIGYARRNQFIVYTQPERIAMSSAKNIDLEIFCV